jgi:RimJ/RimL family protein N-acetyltransferase
MEIVFETPRLVVRTYCDDDVDFVYDMYSRWEVQQYLGSAPRVMESRDRAVEKVRELAACTPDQLLGAWAIVLRDDGRRLGTVLLKKLPLSEGIRPVDEHDDVEVGWHLHPDAWGHGYASEAGAGALRRAFQAGVDEVFAVTYPQNVASQAVCRRIGMTHLGSTDRYYDVTSELFRAARGNG